MAAAPILLNYSQLILEKLYLSIECCFISAAFPLNKVMKV